MAIIAREIAQSDVKQFNKLAPDIMQSWQWGMFRLQTPSVAEVIRLGFFENNTLVRAYQIFFHKIPYSKKTYAYIPRCHTPEIDDLKLIDQYCQKYNAVSLKIEPIDKPVIGFTPSKAILPKHTLVVNITKSEDEILASMHEKTRYNIRVAQKGGITVLERDDSDSLEWFIKLYDATQKRQGFVAKSGDYIRTLWSILRPEKFVYLLCAYIPDNPNPLAAIILFSFNDCLSFPYGGWSSEHREMMPNNLLHFEAIRLGKKLELKRYDFWSSYKENPTENDPWYGTYVFKKGFGTLEAHYPGAFEKVYDQTTYSLLSFVDKIRWPIYKIKRMIG